jgi:uncharacterized protein with HEPN domain
MSDMRNQLTHVYDVTDYEIVWDTLANDFPGVHHTGYARYSGR